MRLPSKPEQPAGPLQLCKGSRVEEQSQSLARLASLRNRGSYLDPASPLQCSDASFACDCRLPTYRRATACSLARATSRLLYTSETMTVFNQTALLHLMPPCCRCR